METTKHERRLADRQELIGILSRYLTSDGSEEPLPGLRLYRTTNLGQRLYGVTKPSFCVVAQGAKEVTAGEAVLRYDADRYLIATAEMPVTARIVDASPQRPYLALRLELDPVVVASVMMDAAQVAASGPAGAGAMYVSTLDFDLLDATVRLMRLVDSPTEAPVLMPLLIREIVFRLLVGPSGDRLRQLPAVGPRSGRVAGAVQRLRRDFDKPVSIEGLAKEIGMSSSGFHQHFKSVTFMSPLQFQKQLRLQEALRLMLGEDMDVAGAGYRVGYENASHFSRDNKKHFGASPARHVEAMRHQPMAAKEAGNNIAV